MLKKIILFLLLSTITLTSWGYDFEVDGIYYKIVSLDQLTCEVTYNKGGGSRVPCDDYVGEITIPNKIEYNGKNLRVVGIGSYAFYACEKLNKVNITEGIESIGHDSFYASGITEVYIPSTVTYIGGNDDWPAFGHCSKLKEIIVDSNNPYYSSLDGVVYSKNMETVLFYPGGKTDNEYVTPKGCKIIGDHFCDESSNPQRVILSDDVNIINENAFHCSRGIKYLQIGKNVKKIGEAAFFWATGLKKLYICDNTYELLFDYPSQNIRYSSTGYLFQDVVLDSLYLGRNAQWSKAYSTSPFSAQTSLSYLGIGKYVTKIFSFTQCKKISKVECFCQKPPSLYDTKGGFDNSTFINATLCVPYGCAEEYRKDDVWGKFWNIIENEPIVYQINVETNGFGTIIINGDTSLNKTIVEGSNNIIEIIPFDGYRLRNVLVNGEDETESVKNGTLYIESVNQNVSIIVNFEEIPIHLTIKNADNGSIAQEVEKGKAYKFIITPSDGWQIESVSFNGSDVTSQMVDNLFVTPSIIEDSELNIVYKQDESSAVKDVRGESKVRVFASCGKLHIVNNGSATDLSVYSLSGSIVMSESIGSGTTNVDFPTNNIYIVKVGDETFKVAM